MGRYFNLFIFYLSELCVYDAFQTDECLQQCQYDTFILHNTASDVNGYYSGTLLYMFTWYVIPAFFITAVIRFLVNHDSEQLAKTSLRYDRIADYNWNFRYRSYGDLK